MNAFAKALSAALNYAIVSHDVLNNHQDIGFLYKESPAFEQDSGWRLFSGMESDEYVENPAHFSTLLLSDVLQDYPQLNELMSEKEGAWEWDDILSRYVAVSDWQPRD